MGEYVQDALFVTGGVLVVTGVALIYRPLGIILAGAALVFIGYFGYWR